MNPTTSTITINVQTNEQGHFIAQISSDLDLPEEEVICYGQSREHAIAIALERLAITYRNIIDEQQNTDWNAVELSETGEPIKKRYHVVLHYETVWETAAKFEAFENTIMENLVVENAIINVIDIDNNLPVNSVERG